MGSETFTWAGRISAGAAAALGSLRLIHGLEAGRVNGEIWVRGPRLKPADEEAARQVPWEERYNVVNGDRLRRAGRLLTEERFPGCDWNPLQAFLRPRLPDPIAPGHQPEGVRLELRPVARISEPNLLEAESQDWLSYVETAPEIRLQCLAFALDEQDPGRVLIRGTPLPPLPGARFVEAESIATPAGLHWYPAISAPSVRTFLGAKESELMILRTDGCCVRVPRSAWNAAARATVRLMLAPEKYA